MWLGDPIYYTPVIPGLFLATWAQFRVSATLLKGSRAASFSGSEAALRLFHDANLDEERISRVTGPLADFYDLRGQELRLSPAVHDGRSLRAIGIACHEAGHALQRAARYPGLIAQTLVVPAATLGSHVCWILAVSGYMAGMLSFILLAIGLFSANVALQLANLVVEHDASRRGLEVLRKSGLITEREAPLIESMMSAAAMSHVGATLTGVLELIPRFNLASVPAARPRIAMRWDFRQLRLGPTGSSSRRPGRQAPNH